MNIEKIQGKQNFNGIRISKRMPSEIVRAIKDNPVIKKAGKNYSLWFNHSKNSKNNVYITSLNVTTPNIDSVFSLMTTPPHSIKTASYYLGMRTNGVLNKLENIKNTPDFFEKLVGAPRTLKQRLYSIYGAFKIAFLTDKDIQSGKAKKVIDAVKLKSGVI